MQFPFPTVILNLILTLRELSSYNLPRHSVSSHVGFLVDRESFFCEVSLDLANCKACLVNNLPLGNECLKRILHASLALFAPSALRKAEKSSRHLKAERLERKGK